jgi:hypothetical protein
VEEVAAFRWGIPIHSWYELDYDKRVRLMAVLEGQAMIERALREDN